MKQTVSILYAASLSVSVCVAQQATNSPANATNNPASSTNSYTGLTPEEAVKEVIKPPTSPAPSAIIPQFYDLRPTPPLSTEAQKHQYLGFRLGMTVEEATLLAQTSGKALDELEKDKKYSMSGCLLEVPRPEKARTILIFEKGKLNLIMLLWDEDRVLYYRLQQMLEENYGKPLKADELFRRYWILQNADCIRLLYEVAAHQISLLYGDKESVFRHSEIEKLEIPKKYKNFP